MSSRFERVESETVYEGKFFSVRKEVFRHEDGEAAEREIVVHTGAVGIVALDGEELWFVRQPREAIGVPDLLEIPAGKLDGGEAPETCAAREVEEEVGRRAGKLTPLGFIWTTPGFTDERIWLYLARDLTETRQALERDEWLTVEHLPLKEALRLAEEGTITDAKSVCALVRAAKKLGLR